MSKMMSADVGYTCLVKIPDLTTTYMDTLKYCCVTMSLINSTPDTDMGTTECEHIMVSVVKACASLRRLVKVIDEHITPYLQRVGVSQTHGDTSEDEHSLLGHNESATATETEPSQSLRRLVAALPWHAR